MRKILWGANVFARILSQMPITHIHRDAHPPFMFPFPLLIISPFGSAATAAAAGAAAAPIKSRGARAQALQYIFFLASEGASERGAVKKPSSVNERRGKLEGGEEWRWEIRMSADRISPESLQFNAILFPPCSLPLLPRPLILMHVRDCVNCSECDWLWIVTLYAFS